MTLSSYSSSSSSAARVAPATPVKCKFTFENYTSMAKQDKDMNQACIDPACDLLRREHALKAAIDPLSFRMPSKENFPTFRDPKDKLMHDPYEYLSKLNRAMRIQGVPPERYGHALLMGITDRLQQEWIETNLLATNTSWDEVQRRFKEQYDDPALRNQLMLQLEKCTQHMSERVYEYTERYQSLVVRVSGGAPIDNQMNIVSCERGFIPAIREKLASFRAGETQKLGHSFEFTTLMSLYKAAATCETGLEPRPGRAQAADRARPARRGRSYRGGARVYNVQPTEQAMPAVHKIEMDGGGRPVNTNKKHKRKVSFSSPAATSSLENARGRGGGILKYRGGGGSFRGRGGRLNIDGTATPQHSTSSSRPDRHTVRRGQSNGTAQHRAPFDGECYNCHKHGHRAIECPARS